MPLAPLATQMLPLLIYSLRQQYVDNREIVVKEHLFYFIRVYLGIVI